MDLENCRYNSKKLSEGLGRCPKNLQGTSPLTHFRALPGPVLAGPFDFRWNCGQVEGFKYGAMDMIPRLNSRLKDTDYGIACHAYPETFEDPVFTDDIYTLEKADTYMINLKNLHVLTDYMQQADMLSPTGKVRHLISPSRASHPILLPTTASASTFRLSASKRFTRQQRQTRMLRHSC